MTRNLIGVGDDRWLRESLRRDPLQELRECKEELARKTELLQQIHPPPKCQASYKEVTSPKYVYEYTRREEPYARPASAHPYTYPSVNHSYHQVAHQTYQPRITTERLPDVRNVEEENSVLKDKVANLQVRIDRLLKGREDVEAEGSAAITIWDEMITQLSDLFSVTVADKTDRLATSTTILSRMRELRNELVLSKRDIVSLTTEADRYKRDYEISQETIARMADQLSNGHATDTDKTGAIATLNQHLLEAATEKDRLDAEVTYLKSRLDGANAAWEAAKEQTSGSILQKEEITTQLAEMDHEKKVLQSEVNLFIGNIANILSSPTTVVEPTLDAIRDHVKQVHGSHDSNARAVKILEQKLIEVTQQLEKQCELHTETLRRAKRLEDEKNTHQDRFITIEDNLATASVLNTTLQGQRDRFTAFLQDLADALKLTGSDTTRDLELSTELLLQRARQLGSLNTDELAEKSSGLYSLRRQLKTAKEQVKSKELHIEMMRKKMARLEDESTQRSAISVDRDDAIIALQKCQKKNERMKMELSNERQLILELKAKMSDIGEVRSSNMELIDQLQKAKIAVEKLTNFRDKQKFQLTEMRDELKLSSHSATSDRETLHTQLLALTSDLKTTKLALDDIIKRERMLIEFREVVARMLGLDVSRLAVPDYEVITRLERLIQNHHATNAGLHPGVPVNTAMQDPAFQAGFMHVPVEIVNSQDTRPNQSRPRRQRY